MKRTTTTIAALLVLICGAAVDARAQDAGAQDAQVEFNTLMLRYEVQKKTPGVPFLLNFLLPFGVGSFVQGDTVGGIVVAGGQVAGGALMLADNISDGLGTMFWIGVGVSAGVTIAGWIMPFTHAAAFNDQLRRDLGIAIDGRGISVRLASW